MIIEAAFVYAYAKRYGATPELPPWFGDNFFELPYAPMSSRELPTYNEKGGRFDYPIPPNEDEAINHDYQGYCQYHTSWYALDKEFIQSLFKLKPDDMRFGLAMADYFDNATVVGLHIRRGDYGQLMYYITPVEWYKKKLAEIWPTLENPILFISSEDPKLVDEFSEYNPYVAEAFVSLETNPYDGYQYLEHDKREKMPHQIDFFPDFYLLSQCNVMLAPNSTFSFAAAMISTTLREFYRSDLRTQQFELVDPWDAPPLRFEMVDDYPYVPGISLESNPYWSKQPGGQRLRRP